MENTHQARPADSEEARPLLLVVDDNLDVIMGMRILFQAKYRVAFASNGEEGIDQAINLRPHLVLTDMEMQGMPGDLMISEIRKQPGLDKVPVIVMTGMLDRATRARIAAVNPDDFFWKPFSMTELMCSVERLTRRA